MAQLIIHSDDFGLHGAVNDAILECARAGVLSSTTILANGDAVETALSQAKELPSLGIGVHLNIVRGRPLSSVDSIPSLVSKGGLFFNSIAHLYARSKLGLLRVSDICTEYRRQIQRIIDGGVTPSHLDSEKHSHILLPEAAEALSRVSAEFHIRKIRRVNESPLSKWLSPADVPWPQRIKRWMLERNTRRAAIHWRGLASTDYTFGLGTVGCRDREGTMAQMRKLFEIQEAKSIEWFFHLAHPFDYESIRTVWGSYSMKDDRVTETRFLLSNEVRALVSDFRHDLISYRDLDAGGA